jgi:heme-degrading monooxygenase HmoA
VITLEGAPQKSRVVIQLWDSMEQLQAYRDSAEFKQARKIGEKYVTFRTFVVEGLPH